jgi:hypothetical protein
MINHNGFFIQFEGVDNLNSKAAKKVVPLKGFKIESPMRSFLYLNY